MIGLHYKVSDSGSDPPPPYPERLGSLLTTGDGGGEIRMYEIYGLQLPKIMFTIITAPVFQTLFHKYALFQNISPRNM